MEDEQGKVRIKLRSGEIVSGVTDIIVDDAVDPEDVETLQDMIVAAVNEAIRAADEDSKESMSRFTGGLGGLM